MLRSFSTTLSTAIFIPRLSATGSIPAETHFKPLLKIASANTVAVVVPSPATSLVLDATSFTSFAPIFSYGSFNSISSATDTPSLVIVGLPHPLSRTAFLPLGPRVLLTALESFVTPLLIAILASSLNTNCFAAIVTSFQNYKHYILLYS